MPRFTAAKTDFHATASKTAVILVNLGTPDAPETSAVRRYLAEFLSDPRVIEIPRLLWRIILHGVILRIRPARSARAYQSVWTTQGSPLLVISKKLRDAVAAQIKSDPTNPILVALAMRYGNPSIASVLRELRAQAVQKIIVLPLYPQYSATTTASTFDAIVDELKTWRWVPDLQFVQAYYHESLYLDALAASVQAHWNAHGRADRLLMSFHGIPQRYFDNGDPYFCHCHATARRLAERLQLSHDQYSVAFQSRVGREQWLKPYTDEVLNALPAQQVKSLQVICPGFAVDCLETLEEIAVENRERFLHAGGERFEYISALNESTEHATALASIISRRLLAYDSSGSTSSNDIEDQNRATRNRSQLSRP